MSKRPSSQPIDGGELGVIEHVAADWMIQRDHGLSAAQEAELAFWLAADERHRAAFKALEATWDLMGEARKTSVIVPTHPVRRRSRLSWIPVGLAAALGAVILWMSGIPFPAQSDGSYSTTTTTGIGVLRELDLPDGSVVQINTDSKIEVRFTRAARGVRLVRGEAHFSVAKNPARPFIVSAGDVEMRAVGTAFNVRLRSSAVEVLVTEGSVKVAATELLDGKVGSDGGSGKGVIEGQSLPVMQFAEYGQNAGSALPLLTAGQRMVVSLAPDAFAIAPPTIAAVDPQAIVQALAWQQRRLDFESAPLPEMVSEINRYNAHKLVIADPRLESQRFGGSFPAGDYDAFVRLLETNFGVIVERKGNETFLRLGR